MAVATTAIIGAALGAVSGIVGNQKQKSATAYALQKYGIDQAAIDVNAASQQNALVAETSALQQTVQKQSLQIEQNLQADQASAEVAAAAAGVSGNAVDTTITDLHGSAGMAQGSLNQMETNQKNKLEQASRDIELNADAARSNLEVERTNDLLNVFSSGLQGFLRFR